MKKILILAAASLAFSTMSFAQTENCGIQITNEYVKAGLNQDYIDTCNVSRAGNPTYFQLDTMAIPGTKQLIVTATLTDPNFIGTVSTGAYPISYWCFSQASPDMFFGLFVPAFGDTVTSTSASLTDTIDFSLYDWNCTNPYSFAFRYGIFGFSQGDTAQEGPLFYLEKVMTVTFNPPLGIDDQNNIDDITMYPNPGSDFVTIDGVSDVGQISVFDMSGRSIRTIKVQSDKVIMDVSDMVDGIYMVQFDKGAAKKLLVKH